MSDELLHPDNALELVLSVPVHVGTELVPVTEAVGRVLPAPVLSPLDSPPFEKALMDGYAVRSADAGTAFRIVEVIAAGNTPRHKIGAGECAKIMTGAMMPEGADKVVRVEYTREEDGMMTLQRAEPGNNVLHKAENLKRGTSVIAPGILRTADIAVLASLGMDQVEVAVRPVVGVLTTGSELKRPGEPLEPGQIYNSNSYQMVAQAKSAGARAIDYGIVPDDKAATRDAIARAFSECDVVLLSGGVSMGDFDFVPSVLQELGVTTRFYKVRVKPGKPTLFGEREADGRRGYVFGLPGNPVSSYVIFELFVRPFLYHLAGHRYRPLMCRGVLAQEVARTDAERVEYRPARMEGARVIPLAYHGSSHLNALSGAQCLFKMEEGVHILEAESEIDVRQL